MIWFPPTSCLDFGADHLCCSESATKAQLITVQGPTTGPGVRLPGFRILCSRAQLVSWPVGSAANAADRCPAKNRKCVLHNVQMRCTEKTKKMLPTLARCKGMCAVEISTPKRRSWVRNNEYCVLLYLNSRVLVQAQKSTRGGFAHSTQPIAEHEEYHKK